MINPNRYSHRISILFNNYLQGRLGLEEFIQKLRNIEAMHKGNLGDNNPEHPMWFKFSKDDSLVTTIDDLETDLSNNNRDFILQRMREAIDVEQELFVHYS